MRLADRTRHAAPPLRLVTAVALVLASVRRREDVRIAGDKARLPPRWFIKTFWHLHRRTVATSHGRKGLWHPRPGEWGALRLTTTGRRSGEPRSVILGSGRASIERLMPPVTQAARRWLFKGGRANRLAAALNRSTAMLALAGLSPRRLVVIEVRGRRSGRLVSLPVVVADLDGERYLVAMLGRQANWVRNVRAANGDAVLRHGRREHVRLREVEPAARAPILQRYLQVAPGARAHVPVDPHAPLAEFERVASDFPVFRIAPAAEDPRKGTPVRQRP